LREKGSAMSTPASTPRGFTTFHVQVLKKFGVPHDTIRLLKSTSISTGSLSESTRHQSDSIGNSMLSQSTMSQSNSSESDLSAPDLSHGASSESDLSEHPLLEPAGVLSQPNLLEDAGFAKLELPCSQPFTDGAKSKTISPKIMTEDHSTKGSDTHLHNYRKVLDVEQFRNGFRVKVEWEAKGPDGIHTTTEEPLSKWTKNPTGWESLAIWAAGCANPQTIFQSKPVWGKMTQKMKHMGLTIPTPKKTTIANNRFMLEKKTKRKRRRQY